MTRPAAPGGSLGSVGRAVVLGPGGLPAPVSGLRRGGVDLGEAGLIVGTSAGAIVGAALATGQDLDRLAALPRSADPGSATHGTGPGWLAQVFTVLADPTLERRPHGAGSAGLRWPHRPAPSTRISHGWVP